MEEEKTTIRERLEHIKDQTIELAETSYKLAAVHATEKLVNAASSIIIALLVLLFSNFFLVFIGIFAAQWIGEALNDLKMGYLIISGMYLLFILLLVFFRKQLFTPFFRNHIVKSIYD